MKALIACVLIASLAGCAATTSAPASPHAGTEVGMPNPASVACANQGGKLDLRKDATGNVTGICVFADGRECEEWALYRDHRCVAPTDVKH